MPRYTGLEQVRAGLPLDLPNTFGDNYLDSIIQMWSGYVDDYLAGQYQTPFPDYPNTPPAVVVATTLLVVYDLYVRAGMPSERDDPRQSLWKRAHEILDQIRDRKIILGSGEDKDGAVRSTPPLPTDMGTNPASLARQMRELGPPHRSVDWSWAFWPFGVREP